MNEQKQKRLVCTLGIKPSEEGKGCHPNKCKTCGWEKAEDARRRKQIRQDGLTLCPDGLKRCLVYRGRNKK